MRTQTLVMMFIQAGQMELVCNGVVPQYVADEIVQMAIQGFAGWLSTQNSEVDNQLANQFKGGVF